jgi:hypothetical protein
MAGVIRLVTESKYLWIKFTMGSPAKLLRMKVQHQGIVNRKYSAGSSKSFLFIE